MKIRAMNICTPVVLVTAAFAAAAGMVQATTAFAGEQPCSYSVTKIPGPSCPFTGPQQPTPRGMNNFGHWVGHRSLCSTGTIGIHWTPETGIVSLPLPPGTVQSRGWDINDIGTIVGETNYRARIWIDGTSIDVPALGGSPPHSSAVAVNNSNVVVGWRNVSDGSNGQAHRYAFIWRDGEVEDIDPLQYGFIGAEATDISDAGHVVGNVYSKHIRGFRTLHGRLQILEPLPGWEFSSVRRVNASGVAVGGCSIINPDRIPVLHMPTIWGVSGDPTLLALLPGYSEGWCTDIDVNGVVLGEAFSPVQRGLPQIQPVIWVNGVPRAIRPMLNAPDTGSYFQAWRMNDSGQLVGNGHIAPLNHNGVWLLDAQTVTADLTGDCHVDGADLQMLLSAWGTAEGVSSADLDGDGKVDGADLGVLLCNWSAG